VCSLVWVLRSAGAGPQQFRPDAMIRNRIGPDRRVYVYTVSPLDLVGVVKVADCLVELFHVDVPDLSFGNPLERAAVYTSVFDVVEVRLVYFDH
jgi:hypothetical protein